MRPNCASSCGLLMPVPIVLTRKASSFPYCSGVSSVLSDCPSGSIMAVCISWMELGASMSSNDSSP